MAQENKMTSSQKVLFYGGLTIVSFAVVAPVLAVAASGAVSMMKLGVCIAVLWATWLIRPWFVVKWGNIVLKLLKAEARANPIETLQNELLGRKESFEEAKKRLVSLQSMRLTLNQRVKEFEKQYGEPEKSLVQMLAGLSALVDKLENKLNIASNQLTEFEGYIRRQSAQYEIALATGKLAQALRQADGNSDPMRQFLHDEAIESVRVTFNDAMAGVNQLLQNDSVVSQVNDDTRLDGVIDIEPIVMTDTINYHKEAIVK